MIIWVEFNKETSNNSRRNTKGGPVHRCQSLGKGRVRGRGRVSCVGMAFRQELGPSFSSGGPTGRVLVELIPPSAFFQCTSPISPAGCQRARETINNFGTCLAPGAQRRRVKRRSGHAAGSSVSASDFGLNDIIKMSLRPLFLSPSIGFCFFFF